jgi:hypothetical protein
VFRRFEVHPVGVGQRRGHGARVPARQHPRDGITSGRHPTPPRRARAACRRGEPEREADHRADCGPVAARDAQSTVWKGAARSAGTGWRSSNARHATQRHGRRGVAA